MSSPLLLIAIALGVIGVCYEFCAPGYIWPGTLGGLIAAVALYHAVANGLDFRRPLALGIAIPTAAVLVFLISTAVRADRNKQFLGDDSYRDELGMAVTPVHHSGTVRVRSENWRAKSSVEVPAGAEVVVRRKDGPILEVTPR
jgi:membrane-bound ClpP family serine protease